MDAFEILREKWRKAFRIHMNFDYGLFGDADFEANMEAVRNMGPAFPDKLDDAHSLGLLWLTNLFSLRFGRGKLQVTVDEGVETWAWFYLKYPRLFPKRLRDYWKAMFEVIDLNKDGVISIEEYRVCSYINRMTDDQVTNIFALLDADGDGVISMEEYLDAYYKFYCDPTVAHADIPLFG